MPRRTRQSRALSLLLLSALAVTAVLFVLLAVSTAAQAGTSRPALRTPVASKMHSAVRRASLSDTWTPGSPTIYVATGGDDTASGDETHPLATLTKALRTAVGGERILLAPGDYAAAADSRARSTWVTVQGPGSGQARVAGLTVGGGQWLDVSGISFTAPVVVKSMWTPATGTQPANHITLHDNDLTAPGATCVGAKDGSTDIVIRSNVIHNCLVGFGAGAGGKVVQSSRLTIEGNRIVDLTGDAISFGQWNDVRIAQNVIDNVRDPAGVYHDDGIQLTGNDARVVIDSNRITKSRTQLIYIQDAVGPIDDVLVTDNLMSGAGAVAFTSRGATNVRVLQNTVTGGKDGGIWLGKGSARPGHAPTIATDTVIDNNVTQDLNRLDGTATVQAAGNVAPCRTGQLPGTDPLTGLTCVADIAFVNVATGDLHLRADAAARALGSPLATLPFDLDGLARSGTPVPGAYR